MERSDLGQELAKGLRVELRSYPGAIKGNETLLVSIRFNGTLISECGVELERVKAIHYPAAPVAKGKRMAKPVVEGEGTLLETAGEAMAPFDDMKAKLEAGGQDGATAPEESIKAEVAA